MKDNNGTDSPTGSLAPQLKLADPNVPIAMPSKPAAEVKSQLQKTWNTKNLGFRLASDLASASAAASIVAPLIAVIDRFVLPFVQHPLF